MKAILFIAHAVVGLVQILAIGEGLTFAFGVMEPWNFGAAFFIAWAPLIGPGFSVYSAATVWGWEPWQAFLFFFWHAAFRAVFFFIRPFLRLAPLRWRKIFDGR